MSIRIGRHIVPSKLRKRKKNCVFVRQVRPSFLLPEMLLIDWLLWERHAGVGRKQRWCSVHPCLLVSERKDFCAARWALPHQGAVSFSGFKLPWWRTLSPSKQDVENDQVERESFRWAFSVSSFSENFSWMRHFSLSCFCRVPSVFLFLSLSLSFSLPLVWVCSCVVLCLLVCLLVCTCCCECADSHLDLRVASWCRYGNRFNRFSCCCCCRRRSWLGQPSVHSSLWNEGGTGDVMS